MATETSAQGRVGPVSGADGAFQTQRLDKTGALVTADAHGRYAEAVRRGRVFIAANTAAQAVSVALTTTYTGLCLSNPLGNTANAEILGIAFAESVAPAAIASLHLIGGYSAAADVTHTTPLTTPGIRNCLIGSSAASSMKADSAATITNPTYLIPLAGGFTAAALPSSGGTWVDLGGLFVLGPGAWVALGALTAVTGFAAIVFEEL